MERLLVLKTKFLISLRLTFPLRFLFGESRLFPSNRVDRVRKTRFAPIPDGSLAETRQII